MTDYTRWRPAEWTRPQEEIEALVAITVKGHRFESADSFLDEYPELLKVPRVGRHRQVIASAVKKADATGPNNTEVEVVELYIKQLMTDHLFVTMRDVLWVYDTHTGIWVSDQAEGLIADYVAKDLHDKTKYRSRIIAEVTKGIKDLSHKPGVVLGGPPNIITCRNGRLDLNTGQFVDVFSPFEYHITAIPTTYDPNAECPVFKKFFSEVVDEQKDRDAVLEFLGYCLYKRHLNESTLLLLGEGSNGKSTLLNVLIALIGEGNYSAASLQELTENRFRTAQLHGKLANISADISARVVKSTNVLKALTGDVIQAEKKGQEPFEFRSYAKLIFSANKLPPSADDSLAYYRRFRIVDFPHTFDPVSPGTDKHLGEKMTTPNELSGILNLMVTGLQRLLKRGMLTGEMGMKEKRADYIKRSDSVHYFSENFVTEGGNEYGIPVGDMYGWYVQVAHIIKAVPVGQKKFTHEMRRFVPFAEIEKKRYEKTTEYAWMGCTVAIEKLAELEDQKTKEAKDQKAKGVVTGV